MSKTGNDVKKNVYAITRFNDEKFDEDLSATDAFLIAINEAIRELADRSWLIDEYEVIAESPNTYYDLPADCTVIISVTDSEGCQYLKWRVDGDMIAFDKADVFKVCYKPFPAEITTLTAALPYRDMYFTAICDYCKYWVYTYDDEESNVAKEWYQRFVMNGERAYAMTNKNKGLTTMGVERRRRRL